MELKKEEMNFLMFGLGDLYLITTTINNKHSRTIQK